MHAVYGCTADGSPLGDCSPEDILNVGSKPRGVGKWGQLDLGGSMAEPTLDFYVLSPPDPCNDCAQTSPTSQGHVIAGGDWFHEDPGMAPRHVEASPGPPASPNMVGVRCARPP